MNKHIVIKINTEFQRYIRKYQYGVNKVVGVVLLFQRWYKEDILWYSRARIIKDIRFA